MIVDIDDKKYMIGPPYDDGSTRVVELKEVSIEEIVFDKQSAYTDLGYKKLDGDIEGFILLGTERASGDYFRRTGTIDKRTYFEEVGLPFRAIVSREANSNYSMTKL